MTTTEIPARRVAAIVLLLLVSVPACGHYVLGPSHRPGISSISVPVFTTDSNRRGLEVRLTEAVHREIQRRMPYRLVPGPRADSRLTGRIVSVGKNVLGETKFDDPRELQLSLAVEVTWTDLRTKKVLAEDSVPVDSTAVPLVTRSSLAPEVGQSLATASQEAIDRMARRIVDLLEAPW